MRKRAVAILIQDHAIALIERHRPNRHYIIFPGGGIEASETPEAAVIREVEEELGLLVSVRRLVAERYHRDVVRHYAVEYYFLVDILGGEFGSGQGEEYSQAQPPEQGTFHPIWMPLDHILGEEVVPRSVARLVVRSHPDAWPDQVFRIDAERED